MARRAHGEPQYPPLVSLPEPRVGAIRLRRMKAMSSVAVIESQVRYSRTLRRYVHGASSFRRWHLRDRHSLQPFSEFPLKVRLQTGRERKSHTTWSLAAEISDASRIVRLFARRLLFCGGALSLVLTAVRALLRAPPHLLQFFALALCSN